MLEGGRILALCPGDFSQIAWDLSSDSGGVMSNDPLGFSCLLSSHTGRDHWGSGRSPGRPASSRRPARRNLTAKARCVHTVQIAPRGTAYKSSVRIRMFTNHRYHRTPQPFSVGRPHMGMRHPVSITAGLLLSLGSPSRQAASSAGEQLCSSGRAASGVPASTALDQAGADRNLTRIASS